MTQKVYKDTYKAKGLRNKLVENLKDKGITNKAVLDAIGTIPRHYFLDSAFIEWAYKDKAFSIGHNQTISHPFTVAVQSSLLEIEKGMKVLEIGTGSGYQACVLSTIGAKVYSIERYEALYLKTTKRLKDIGFGLIRTFFGDGYLGLPKFAPFERIILTASAEFIPKTLVDQLAPNGILVAPVGKDEQQQMVRVLKDENGNIKEETHGLFSFVPFLEGTVQE